MGFAALALQARFRGRRDRKAARRRLRARYQISTDPETGARVFTDINTREASASRPMLFARLGIPEGEEDTPEDEDGGHDSDSEDFDALEDEEELEPDANNGDEAQDGAETTALASTKKNRRFPRSKAQQRVDFAEDNEDSATTLDLSGLDAFKLSSRIWNLQRLSVLVLARNKLTRLPSGIQDLTQLEELDVSHNLLLRLPSCLQTTETLRVLRAPFNRIAGFSPRLWKLRALRELDLSHNALKELPFVEGDLTLLRETREWQVGVGLLRALEVLKLAHNQLVATPVSIGQCEALGVLDLSFNALRGALSDEIPRLAALKELHLAHNTISELPDGLGGLGQLETLDLSHNLLRSLPDGIGELTRLKTIDLSHNELRALPEAFGALEMLQTLILDANPRFVALGGFLRRLGRLERARFADCAIARIESPDVFRDAPIRELVLASNMLAAFALRLGEDSLEMLDLSGNQLERAPTEVLEHCRRLRVLNLRENRLTALPATIGLQVSLETLELSENALELLPDELTQCSSLRELRCDHNYLTALPTRMGMLRSLERLHVAFNRLTVLPSSLCDLVELQCIYANDNLLSVPPPSLHCRSRDGGRACYIDLSNNPFTRVKPAVLVWKEALAEATALIDARQFEQGEQKLSEIIRSTRSSTCLLHWGERRRRQPQWHYQRALSRVLQLPMAHEAIDNASERVAQLEMELAAFKLLDDRQRFMAIKKVMTRKPVDNEDNQNEQDEHLEIVNDKRKEVARMLSEQPEDDEDSNARRLQTSSRVQELVDTRQELTAAVQHYETLARGALADVRVAIAGKIYEAPTAWYLQGVAHMALGEPAEAARSFTSALQAMELSPTGTVARESVHVFERRAEAFSRLGQLPSALSDVRRVLSQFPFAELGDRRREELEETERELARLWEVQRTEYFVDDHETYRAFDVESTTGLPRRPEVLDIIDEADTNDTGVKTRAKKRQGITSEASMAALTPAQRFARDVAAKTQALSEADEHVRAAFDAVRMVNASHLARARDFKREVRENLQLEMEEARQRVVEAELARLAAELATEREREFQEKLFMKYEDEYASWLAAELARLEAERLRRLEAAQRKQEAKAAYEKRLARRGGRRQAQPKRR